MSVALPSNSLMSIAPRPDVVFVRGNGSYLYDGEGRRYLDWVQGWAVNVLGHAPAAVADALAQQARTLINPSPAYFNEPALALAELLTAHSCFDKVFFASSGAEANEGAIKLARKWGRLHRHGAHEIITFANAFHGRTLATMSASGKPGWDTLFAPQPTGFPKASLNDIDSVVRQLGPQTVAIMLEPIQGEAGVIPARPEFVRTLRQLCDEHGLLLIFDEVQTGCGRTGELFAYPALGIEPDIMTLGKGLGGGVPISALLAKDHCSCFSPGDQGGTYCGNPLVCAAAITVMTTLTDDTFLPGCCENAQLLREGLDALAAALALDPVRGKGMLLALDTGKTDAARVVEHARALGLLLNAPRPNCLRFMPALNSTASEIQYGLSLLRESILSARKEHAPPGDTCITEASDVDQL